MSRIVRALGFLIAASAAVASPVAVPTLEVKGAAVRDAFELDGRVEPVRQATVAAQLPGHVLALAVKAGDAVRAGQSIARIDDRDAQAGFAAADAGVSQADANLRNARLSAQRTRDLRGQGFVSQAALDVADTQLQGAEAGLRQAQAARAQAGLARGYATATAPFDGVVLATHVEAGDLAGVGRPLATLYVPGEMRVVVSLPASRAAGLRAGGEGRSVQIDAAGRWIAPARITELPGADAVSQTVDWRLDLPKDAAAAWRPGQSVRVRFAAAAADAASTAAAAASATRLTIPAAALLQRGELTGVYAARDGRFVLKAVRIGARTAEGVEVLAGLRPGERIAADAVKAGLAGAVPQ